MKYHIPSSMGQMHWTVEPYHYTDDKITKIRLWCGGEQPSFVQMNPTQIKQLFDILVAIYGPDEMVEILNGPR
jgi:hypothetical protein